MNLDILIGATAIAVSGIISALFFDEEQQRLPRAVTMIIGGVIAGWFFSPFRS